MNGLENNIEEEADRNGCKYEEFMASQPPILYGEPMPMTVMDWIYEMEMVFERWDCSNKPKTIFVTRQLKTGVLI